MTPCPNHLGVLCCQRPANHAPGCVYHASSGSWVNDNHQEGGHG